MKYRFHILAVPHAVSVKEYSVCAFTQKVIKLSAMLRGLGHYVTHYGHEDSVVDCDEHVTVTTNQDLEDSYPFHDWKTSGYPTFRINDKIYQTFFSNSVREIQKRQQKNDILLLPFACYQRPVAEALPDLIHCEPGIGYAGAFTSFKVFESYALYHAHLGPEVVMHMRNDLWYDAVIPNFFDPMDFHFQTNKKDYLLYLGRIGPGKGLHLALQLAKATNHKLVIAGPGPIDASMIPEGKDIHDYVDYVGVVGPERRRELLSNAKATLCISTFLEPFCGVQIESMMSGTPVISTDFGAFAEYNLHGQTGYRCRTFEQFTWAVDNIEQIKPRKCRDWAYKNFRLDRVAEMYDEYFYGVMNIYTGKGFYQENRARTHLDWLEKDYG